MALQPEQNNSSATVGCNTATVGCNIATYDMRIAAEELLIQTLITLGHPELIRYVQIQWNKRYTSKMGSAFYLGSLLDENKELFSRVYRKHQKVGDGNYLVKIRFSSVLWPRATEEQRRHTVIHEVCHIVCYHEDLLTHRGVSSQHGKNWKELMRRVGCQPTRCHNVPNADLKRKSQKVVKAMCQCATWMITKRRAEKIISGRCDYLCKKCRGALVVLSNNDEIYRTSK